jgi:hypothetical protein
MSEDAWEEVRARLTIMADSDTLGYGCLNQLDRDAINAALGRVVQLEQKNDDCVRENHFLRECNIQLGKAAGPRR